MGNSRTMRHSISCVQRVSVNHPQRVCGRPMVAIYRRRPTSVAHGARGLSWKSIQSDESDASTIAACALDPTACSALPASVTTGTESARVRSELRQCWLINLSKVSIPTVLRSQTGPRDSRRPPTGCAVHPGNDAWV